MALARAARLRYALRPDEIDAETNRCPIAHVTLDGAEQAHALQAKTGARVLPVPLRSGSARQAAAREVLGQLAPAERPPWPVAAAHVRRSLARAVAAGRAALAQAGGTAARFDPRVIAVAAVLWALLVIARVVEPRATAAAVRALRLLWHGLVRAVGGA